MALQNNRAVLLLGAPNSKNLSVSPAMVDLGVTLLKLEPSKARIVALPDRIQPRYGFYLSNLSSYLMSWVEDKPIDATAGGFPVAIPLAKTLPIQPPAMIMSWKAPLSEETTQEIMRKHDAMPVVNRYGVPALSIQKPTLIEYHLLDEYLPDPTTPCIDNHMNFQAYRSAVKSVRLLSAIIALHHYPAWEDSGHMKNYFEDLRTESEVDDDEVVMEVDTPAVRKQKGYIRASGVKHSFASEHYRCFTTVDELPNMSGFFSAFYPGLALYDNKAVPSFINDFLIHCLGESPEEISKSFDQIERDWGVLCNTAWGMEMAHIAVNMRWALRSQAMCLPVLSNANRYMGCLILGEGFTWIQNDMKTFKPVQFSELQGAIAVADTHSASMNILARLVCSTAQERANFTERVKSSARLREELLRAKLREIDTPDIVKACRQLNFAGEKYWPVNTNTLTRAFDAIVNEDISLEGFPIHGSMMLERSRTHVVWSCFGGMAPSFLIPGGRTIELKKELKISSTSKLSRGLATNDISKIACRMFPLERALADLDEVLTKQVIRSPFAQPSVKGSQRNQDRFFHGDQVTSVIAGLRKLCKITEVSTVGSKRKAEDEAGPSKRSRMDDIF